MSTYLFGLSHPRTLAWLSEQWLARSPDDVAGFVDAVLLQPGRHILPSLPETDEAWAQSFRERHLSAILRLYTRQEIRRGLEEELRFVLKLINVEEAEK